MNKNLVPEWNFWERIALFGLDDSSLEKGIKTEEQKFVHNVNKTFIELEQIFKTNYSTHREIFNSSFGSQKEIITSSMNPKVLVYAFTTLPAVIVNVQEWKKNPEEIVPVTNIRYDEKIVKRVIEDIRKYYIKDKKKKKETKDEYSKFLVENGINPESIIRYFRFYQLNL